MDYEQFITEIQKYWDLRKMGLKKQANSFLFSFTKSFKENVPDADAILFRFCREYLDEMKFPGDALPRRHLPFQLTKLLDDYLSRECEKDQMPQMRWAYQIFGNIYNPHDPKLEHDFYPILERAYMHEKCDPQTVQLYFREQLDSLWWGQHHFPESIRITKEEFENIVGVAKKILSEKTVDPQLVKEFEYYMKLYQIYFEWQNNNRNGDFYELCGKEGGAMISEELKKIKSFGSSMESSVTPEDIANKEKELGVTLPQALQELYLTFHPDDPAFTEKGNLIPLEELKIYKRVYWTDTIITILPFCRHERYGYGFEVSRYHKSKDTMSSNDPEDPQMWGLYVLPETRREEKHLEGREVPCNQSKLSQWIMEWLGYQQTLAQPSVAAVNKDKAESYWKKMREHLPNMFYHVPPEQLSSHRTNFSVNFVEEPSRILCGSILYSEMAYFGGRTDEELEQLMKRMGFKYVWMKSQDGHPVFNSAPPQPPQERELKSIAPVLQFLCKFAGIEGKGAKEESIERAGARLGASLPLPLEEFYRYLPGRFYQSYNVVRPLSGLKQAKDGKLNFLTENQAMYHWAAGLNSPFLYRRANDGVGEWNVYGILDGFLAAEFLWALACDEKLALILWELPDFEPSMLSEGGKLSPYLSSIAGITNQIAAGNTRRLYQAMDGQAVGLYDSEECTFWFVTKDETVQERLETFIDIIR